MVKIIAHRGWWTKPEEQNTLPAFERAFGAGIGVELDVRDFSGSLVVSHDPYIAKVNGHGTVEIPYFKQVLDLLGDRDNILAVNVKSCGLAPWFAKLKAPKNWFFFDMATNDRGNYKELKLPMRAKSAVVHSDELHGDPEYMDSWKWLRDEDKFDGYLMTDFPQEAMEFFR